MLTLTRKLKRLLAVALVVGLFALLNVSPALAHGAPDEGAQWLMADWMLFSFMIFFGAGLLTFLFAVKFGLLRNVEKAKYHILTIDEPDYYTPDWVKEEPHA